MKSFEIRTREKFLDLENRIKKLAAGGTGGGGFSPTIETSKSGKVTTLRITDINGIKTAVINDGADGYSPTVSVNKNGTVTTIEITDVNGKHTATINDGVGGGGGSGALTAEDDGNGNVTLSIIGTAVLTATDDGAGNVTLFV
ncbi:MAG: hypothetical protein IKY90_00020 [Oscillospiraceae bacterium]|nr:hypothetical protein [Oscillospiraceae bacterium]